MSCSPAARLWYFACEAPPILQAIANDVLALENQTPGRELFARDQGLADAGQVKSHGSMGFLLQCQVPPQPCANPPAARCCSWKWKSATSRFPRMYLISSTSRTSGMLMQVVSGTGRSRLREVPTPTVLAGRLKGTEPLCAPQTTTNDRDLHFLVAEPLETKSMYW